VKRDPDLSRKILFELEASDRWQFVIDTEGEESKEREYHLELLKDEGLLVSVGKYTYRMTSKGHDYLDAIRSDTVWNKTKEGAAKVGGMTLGMMKDLAIAYVKQEAAEKLGVKL
jgi:RIO-like serine/threonine protein kinase